jgi:hypothetical protein
MGYQVNVNVSVWIEIVRNTVVGPHLLPFRLTVQLYTYRYFLGTFLLGLLADVPLAVRQRLRFSTKHVRHAMEKKSVNDGMRRIQEGGLDVDARLLELLSC